MKAIILLFLLLQAMGCGGGNDPVVPQDTSSNTQSEQQASQPSETAEPQPTTSPSPVQCDATGTWRLVSQNCQGLTFVDTVVVTLREPDKLFEQDAIQVFAGDFSGPCARGALDLQCNVHLQCDPEFCWAEKIDATGKVEFSCSNNGVTCIVVYQKN